MSEQATSMAAHHSVPRSSNHCRSVALVRSSNRSNTSPNSGAESTKTYLPCPLRRLISSRLITLTWGNPCAAIVFLPNIQKLPARLLRSSLRRVPPGSRVLARHLGKDAVHSPRFNSHYVFSHPPL